MSARTTAQAKLIVEGMAYALWVHALSGYAFDETGHEIAGRTRWAEEYDELVHEGRGSVPDAAMEPAMELVNLYEITNGRTLVSMYSDVPFGYFTDAYDYGEALASRALGLPDDTMLAKRARALNNVEPVHFEVSFTGEKLVWTGDAQPPTTNPAKYDEVLREPYGDSTTIVIERGNHGYSAWLESATGGRLPISFRAEKPTNAREALAAAKRFLARVHGRNNPTEWRQAEPPNLTGENISDDQIEALWKTARHNSELYWLCVDAFQTLDSVSMPARARLAEILNERARAAEANLNPADQYVVELKGGKAIVRPATVDEALAQLDQLRRPIAIQVRPAGQYTEIAAARFV